MEYKKLESVNMYHSYGNQPNFDCENYEYNFHKGYLKLFKDREMDLLKEDSFSIKELKEKFMQDYKEEIKKQIENASVSNGRLLGSIEESIKSCSQVINDINSYIENEYQELKKESIAELSKKLLELENL